MGHLYYKHYPHFLPIRICFFLSLTLFISQLASIRSSLPIHLIFYLGFPLTIEISLIMMTFLNHLYFSSICFPVMHFLILIYCWIYLFIRLIIVKNLTFFLICSVFHCLFQFSTQINIFCHFLCFLTSFIHYYLNLYFDHLLYC